jgi:DNA (cytosine-5)-methyltransferase 1
MKAKGMKELECLPWDGKTKRQETERDLSNLLSAEGYDLFSGAGGTTTGIEQAKYEGVKIGRVLACINHDDVAIASHAANHSAVKHFIEDVRGFDVSRFPESICALFTFIWISLECTNFSNAKGGQPRDADSRTLAEHIFPYIEKLNPNYIFIENVREFMSWGDLDDCGKPVSKDKGRLFLRWVKNVCSYGYTCEWKILNSADFGAYTSRKRLFIIFAKNGMPIVWPETTHAKGGGFGMPKWKAVKDVLDLEDKGESIFGRKKPLSENTYKRIYAGLVKYIAGGDESFLAKYYSGLETAGLNNPSPTLTTKDRMSLVSPEFLLKWLSNDPKTGSNNGVSIDGPAPVVTTQNRLGLCQPEFLINYQHSSKVNSIDDPSPTITTHDKYAKIHADCFLDMQYSQGQRHQSAEEPCGSLLTVPKQKLISAQFLDQQYGKSKPRGIDEPVGSLVANPKENLITAFLMNTQYSSDGQGLDRPCFTLIARMDKKPPYLISTAAGNVAIEVYESDSPMMQKIKQFMAAYGIVDIKMRMLKVKELLRIQGFPEDYKLMGNQAQQKKFIGNAVVPVMSKKLIEALYEANLKQQKEKAA